MVITSSLRSKLVSLPVYVLCSSLSTSNDTSTQVVTSEETFLICPQRVSCCYHKTPHRSSVTQTMRSFLRILDDHRNGCRMVGKLFLFGFPIFHCHFSFSTLLPNKLSNFVLAPTIAKVCDILISSTSSQLYTPVDDLLRCFQGG